MGINTIAFASAHAALACAALSLLTGGNSIILQILLDLALHTIQKINELI